MNGEKLQIQIDNYRKREIKRECREERDRSLRIRHTYILYNQVLKGINKFKNILKIIHISILCFIIP